MQDIQLSPFEGPSRAITGLRSTRLDALGVPDMLDAADGAVAAVAGGGGGDKEGRSTGSESLHIGCRMK